MKENWIRMQKPQADVGTIKQFNDFLIWIFPLFLTVETRSTASLQIIWISFFFFLFLQLGSFSEQKKFHWLFVFYASEELWYDSQFVFLIWNGLKPNPIHNFCLAVQTRHAASLPIIWDNVAARRCGYEPPGGGGIWLTLRFVVGVRMRITDGCVEVARFITHHSSLIIHQHSTFNAKLPTNRDLFLFSSLPPVGMTGRLLNRARRQPTAIWRDAHHRRVRK